MPNDIYGISFHIRSNAGTCIMAGNRDPVNQLGS